MEVDVAKLIIVSTIAESKLSRIKEALDEEVDHDTRTHYNVVSEVRKIIEETFVLETPRKEKP